MLSEYIKVADDKKVKAIYTIVEREINEINLWWNDKDLVEELNTRSADMKSGKDEGIGWEELEKLIKRSTPQRAARSFFYL